MKHQLPLICWCYRVARTFVPLRNNPFGMFVGALVLATGVLPAASLLTFDPARRVAYDSNFTLNTFHWDAAADTNEVRVFDVLDNVLPQYDETQGSAHADWNEAHATMTHGQHQTVAVLDQGQHGALVADTVATYAPCASVLIVPTTYGDADVAAKIMALPESMGSVCMSFGFTSSKPPTNTLNAMRARTNILFTLAALNGFGSEDNSRDWLCLAALPNAMCITASTHGDEIFGAYGSNVTLAAAGRRVPADDAEFRFRPRSRLLRKWWANRARCGL